MKTIKITAIAAMLPALLSSCHNSDNEFPDFDYQTVYFANQSVGRTVELGRDREVDLTLDNQHRVMVKAVLGGVYKNTVARTIHFDVVPELCDNLYFGDGQGGGKAEVLPEDYYTLESGVISIEPGRHDGGVTVRLDEKFFNDPKAIGYNYVLPIVMTHAEGVDSILQGRPAVENPDRLNASDWSVAPRDYVLYCVKYVNEWHGVYLRRGTDRLTLADGTTSEIVRKADYIERDEEVNVSTSAYRSCEIALSTQTDADHTYAYRLRLDFNAEDGTCAISSAEAGVTVTGSGRFVIDGEKNAISGTDRDALYLDYTVTHPSGWSLKVDDTLVLRNRGVHAEYPEVVVK